MKKKDKKEKARDKKKGFELSADQWQMTFDSVDDLIFIQDTNYTIIKANKAFVNTVKMKREEVIGRKCYEILHKSDKPWYCCSFSKTKVDCSAHTEEVDDPGIGMPLLVTTSPVYDDHDKLIGSIHIAKDISLLKKTQKDLQEREEELQAHVWGLEKTNEAIRNLYKELEIKNAELKKLDQLKSEFVSTVSHELRTPLSITKEGIGLILDQVTGEINDKQRKYLAIARDNVGRLERIINDLLNISKIEAGKTELKRRAVSINNIVRSIATSFRPKTKLRNLEFKTAIPKEEIAIYADSDRITQVFINLVGNALKFTEEGYIEITVKEKQNEVECTVADTGRGIAKEDLPKVFDKFRQFGRADGPGERGTGLGLSISKGLIEMHGGHIWLESNEGKGTKFIFTLPKYSTETLFKEYVSEGLDNAIKSNSKMSLIYIAVKNYAGLKERLGGERTAAIVKKIEEKLVDCLRSSGDVAVRDTGELIAIVSSCDKENSIKVKERLELVLQDYLTGHELSGDVKLQYGYATFPDEASNDEELIGQAKRAS